MPRPSVGALRRVRRATILAVHPATVCLAGTLVVWQVGQVEAIAVELLGVALRKDFHSKAVADAAGGSWESGARRSARAEQSEDLGQTYSTLKPAANQQAPSS